MIMQLNAKPYTAKQRIKPRAWGSPERYEKAYLQGLVQSNDMCINKGRIYKRVQIGWGVFNDRKISLIFMDCIYLENGTTKPWPGSYFYMDIKAPL